MPSRKRFRTVAIAAAATVALGTGLFAGLGPVPGGASSHREAPLVAADPQIDNTDVYAFVSPDDPSTVTLISSWIPFEEPAGGPNFYAFDPNARYEFRIDNNGDAKADVIYRFTFTNHYRSTATFLYNTGVVESLDDGDLNFFQTYDVTRIKTRPGKPALVTTVVDDAVAVPSNVGAASMPDYAALMAAGINGSGTLTFAGQSDDAFFVELRVFDLLFGLDFSEVGDDSLAGFNVNTLALQVPKDKLALDGDPEANPVIGIWSTASRRSTRVQMADGTQEYSGGFVQVSRLGLPLINEAVIPVGDKDKWNGSKPAGDLGNFGGYVLDPEVPKLIELIYGIPAPEPPRLDLVAVGATGIDGLNTLALNAGVDEVTPSEMIRLNMGIPPCEADCEEHSDLGVIGGDTAGFPNGRRLRDDVVDIILQVLEGELVGSPNDLGDGVPANDVAFQDTFPYVAAPHSGSDPAPHARQQR